MFQSPISFFEKWFFKGFIKQSFKSIESINKQDVTEGFSSFSFLYISFGTEWKFWNWRPVKIITARRRDFKLHSNFISAKRYVTAFCWDEVWLSTNARVLLSINITELYNSTQCKNRSKREPKLAFIFQSCMRWSQLSIKWNERILFAWIIYWNLSDQLDERSCM